MIKEILKKFKITPEELYNPERKLQFFEDCYGDQKDQTIYPVLKLYISSFAEMERKNKKDLLNFNIVEIEDIFKNLGIVTNSTFNNRKSIIKKYFQWGVDRHLISIEQLELFNYIGLENVFSEKNLIKKYFKDLDDLINYIDTALKFYKPLDKNQYSVTIITLLLLWCGLRIDQIYSLKTEAINFRRNIIKINKYEYVLPERITQIISNYLKQTSYVVDLKSKGYKYYFYKDTGYFLRVTGPKESYYSKATLFTKISNFGNRLELDQDNKYYGHTLLPEDVIVSGSFYRIYEFEQKNKADIHNVDKKVYLKLLYKEDEPEQKTIDFISEYINWKRTFYGV
ncbi:protein of unknown function [Ruminococcaceae bacterium BL-6]|nr:protein of unknown function [Ruminococcaceae bacterium BL-6]